MKITDELFVAAFSDLVTTFQPKTWPKYIRNCICQTKLSEKSIKFIGLFELQRLLCFLAPIKISDHRQLLFYSNYF